MTDTTRHFITNRFHMRMAVYVTEPEGEVLGTVLQVHGLSSKANRPIFTETTPTFIAAGYRVVSYDATHSLGASDGDAGLCTMSGLLYDMEDVLHWLDTTYTDERQKLVLMGHSLGAMAIGYIHADGNIFVSSVTDGAKSFEYSWTETELDAWQTNGYVERGYDGGYHLLRWSHYPDRCKHSILGTNHPNSLLISGTEDPDRSGTDDLEKSKIESGDTYIRLDLEGAGHSIKELEHIAQVNAAIKQFLPQI